MATRAELRSAVRERLEDTTSAPLWSDAALNAYLVAAARAYGVAIPRRATAVTAAVVLGAVSVGLPAGVPETGIVAVRDGRGRDVVIATERQGPAPADASGLVQAWSVWGSTLRFQRPARGDEVGVWSLDYLAGRELVGDDVTAQPIDAGDEPIVVALVCAQALERRAVEDGKRGAKAADVDRRAASFRIEAKQLLSARKRRVRAGYLAVA